MQDVILSLLSSHSELLDRNEQLKPNDKSIAVIANSDDSSSPSDVILSTYGESKSKNKTDIIILIGPVDNMMTNTLIYVRDRLPGLLLSIDSFNESFPESFITADNHEFYKIQMTYEDLLIYENELKPIFKYNDYKPFKFVFYQPRIPKRLLN